MGYPVGIATALSDVIPLLAIALKPFSGLLPHPFQYLGLFCLTSMGLNYWFGLLLLRRVGLGRWGSHVGAVAFLLSPLVMYRLHGHTALTAHWLILAALLTFLRPIPEGRIWHWIAPVGAICVLSALIHPFFVPMMLMMVGACTVRLGVERKNWGPGLVTLFATSLALVLVLWAVGTVSFDDLGDLAAGGYRSYSMNLLGLVDPQVWHGILYGALPASPSVTAPGYAYLGIGIICMFAVAAPGMTQMFRRTKPSVTLPLLAVASLSFALAVSARVTLGPWELADVPLPHRLETLMNAFRTSERFVWPAYYMIFVAAFGGLRWLPKQAILPTVAASILLQVADLQPIFKSVTATVSMIRTEPPEVTALRPELAGTTHLVVLPMWECGYAKSPGGIPGYAIYGFLALDLGMTLNDYYSSRLTSKAAQVHCVDLPSSFVKGDFAADTAYVVSTELADQLPSRIREEHCEKKETVALCRAEVRSESVALTR
jgi:hypothetical protein